MSERTLKQAFLLAVGLCIVLAGALGYLVFHRDGRVEARSDADPVVASGPSDPKSAPTAPNPTNDEPPLTPLQLSPQRLQEIGVTTALVTMKDANSDIDAPGTVAIDEQRLSTVQTRFSGWVRSVVANATYQYIKKGQPLFTIYSP